MAGTFSNLKNWAIVILIAVVVIMRTCAPTVEQPKDIVNIDGKDYELLEHTIDTVYVDRTIEVPVYVPVQGEVIIREVPQDIDTTAILNDYYSEVVYNDEIQMDSLGTAYITDTISQNKILSRTARFEYTLPTITELTTVKALQVNKVFVGGSIGFNKVTFINNITADILLITKTDKAYGLGIGIDENIEPYIQGSILWKISLRK